MSQKQQWIEPEHPIFSVREQAVLLELNRSNIYYKPRPKTFSEEQQALLRLVAEIYTQSPFFGTRKMKSVSRSVVLAVFLRLLRYPF